MSSSISNNITIDIESHLITLVQRSSSYRLLLSKPSKKTPLEHEDYPSLQLGHKQIFLPIS